MGFLRCACSGVLGLLLLAGGEVVGQQISRLIPEAAAVGDLLIIEGSGLGGVNSVTFQATVGGFVGVWSVSVTPLSTAPGRVLVVVPQMAGFAPPNAVPPGNPVGSVMAVSPTGTTAPNTLPFFFLQALVGVDTAGVGSTQNPVLGRPVVGFTLGGGPPVAGNGNFTLRIENAVPGASTFLVLGFPATPPYLPVGNGTLVVDVTQPFVVLAGPLIVDGQGNAQWPLPIPGVSLGLTFMAQWLELDGSLPGGAGVSNGLQVAL